MPEHWLPTDPRQREIHRLLLLVGGEPAAYFLDACRLNTPHELPRHPRHS